MKQAINLFLSILWDILKTNYYLSDEYIGRKITPLTNLLGSVLNPVQIDNLSRFFGKLSTELNKLNRDIKRFKNLGPDVLDRLHNEKNKGFFKIGEYVRDNEEVIFEDGFKKSTPEFIKCVVDPVYEKIKELEDTKITDLERFIDDDNEIKEFLERHLEDLMFEDFVDFGDELHDNKELNYEEFIDISKIKGIGYDYLEGFINGTMDVIREALKNDKNKYTRQDILGLEKMLAYEYFDEYYENHCKWTDELEADIKKEIKKWKRKMKE